MKTPREKYRNDPKYRYMVDSMVAAIHKCHYTPSEMREAAVLASIIYDESRIREYRIPMIPKSVENALEVMEEVDEALASVHQSITKDNCIHDARTRGTEGFFCRDCDQYFHKDSPTYRSGELLSSLWMALNNISVGSFRAGKGDIREALDMKAKIGIGVAHDNYEDLISEAEGLLAKYGRDVNEAYVVIEHMPVSGLKKRT